MPERERIGLHIRSLSDLPGRIQIQAGSRSDISLTSDTDGATIGLVIFGGTILLASRWDRTACTRHT